MGYISEEEVIEVVAVIKDGMLRDVYSNNQNVNVNLIDLDTLDFDELKEKREELRKIQKDKAFTEVY